MSHVLKLIESQIMMSRMRNPFGRSASRPGRFLTEEGVAFGPCLLFSRECESGASDLAREVGKRLGWNVFDSQIVDEIARASHSHQRLVESVDEHVQSYWEQTWRQLLLNGMPDEAYLRHLQQVILALGHQGDVVIVGRGAQFFLPPQSAVRIRMIAPLEFRAKRLAERAGLSFEQARAKVSRTDQERESFNRKVFGKRIGDPVHHDLIINTSEISSNGAVELALTALEDKLGVHSPGKIGMEMSVH